MFGNINWKITLTMTPMIFYDRKIDEKFNCLRYFIKTYICKSKVCPKFVTKLVVSCQWFICKFVNEIDSIFYFIFVSFHVLL